MNKKSDEQIWREIREVDSDIADSSPVNITKSVEVATSKVEAKPPIEKGTQNKPKSVEFNTTLEDVCLIDDRVQEDTEESDPEEPLTCNFTWSKMSKPSYSNEKNTYLTPWDIGKNYKIRCDERKQSILKKTVPGTDIFPGKNTRLGFLNDIRKAATSKITEKVQNPVPKKEPTDVSIGKIVERSGSSGTFTAPVLPQKPTKRVSLFKQKRLAQK